MRLRFIVSFYNSQSVLQHQHNQMDASKENVESHHLKCVAFKFFPLAVAKSSKAEGIHDCFGTNDSAKTFLAWMEELNLSGLAFDTQAAQGHKHKQSHSKNYQIESCGIRVGQQQQVWIRGLHLDSTNSLPFLDRHINVSALTPSSTPGVAHNIVGNVSVTIVADNGNSMVKIISTRDCICKNTR